MSPSGSQCLRGSWIGAIWGDAGAGDGSGVREGAGMCLKLSGELGRGKKKLPGCQCM